MAIRDLQRFSKCSFELAKEQNGKCQSLEIEDKLSLEEHCCDILKICIQIEITRMEILCVAGVTGSWKHGEGSGLYSQKIHKERMHTD